MKRDIISFVIEPIKPRNRVCEDMLDRNGPYKARREKNQVQYQRREKHRRRFYDQ